jgi:hypothetical protein
MLHLPLEVKRIGEDAARIRAGQPTNMYFREPLIRSHFYPFVPSGAKQAAEKLDFSKSAKNGLRQDALGTIREGWLMVLHPPNSALSPSLRSFSAACKARVLFVAFAARDPEGTPVVPFQSNG